MTDINNNIIELLLQHKSIKEIACMLNLTEKQVYFRIKQIIDYGYNFKPKYISNSDIHYIINKNYYEEKNNSVKINMLNDKEFRCIIISDTHIGNIGYDMNFLKRVYEYAAKNDIHIIFNCGDVIDGTYSTNKRILADFESQVTALIKKHPYDKNINEFIVLGNHDLHSLCFDGLDILKIISKYRYDLIPIGYGKGVVNLKKDSILLKHELSVAKNPDIKTDSKLIISGHGHMMKTKTFGDGMIICAPSLSRTTPDRTQKVIPGFIDLRIEFYKEKFDYIEARHFIVDPIVCEVSQSRCKIGEVYYGIEKNESFAKRKRLKK